MQSVQLSNGNLFLGNVIKERTLNIALNLYVLGG